MSNRGCFWIACCLVASTTILAACSKSETPAGPVATTSLEPPAGQLGDAVVPRRYRLELRIDPTDDTFSGTVDIDVTFDTRSDGFWLHGKDLDVADVYLTDGGSKRIDGSYAQHLDSGVARVSLAEAVAAGPATLHFVYSAPFNTSANALFKIVRGEETYAATQFEPIGARQVFPGFDEPGFKVPFDLTVTAIAEHVVIANTPEVSADPFGDGFVRHTFETTRPMPTYLLAFAVGPYDLVDFGMIAANSNRDREVALRGVAAKGLGARLGYALNNTAGLLSVLEEYFGTPYPYRKLDIIAVPEGFGGAMENVGAITYDEYLILMDEDSALSQRRAFTSVHAHEMAHMWFGNLVTPSWWNDIWLNESFASWMQNKVAHRYWPDGEFDRETLKRALDAMAADSLAAAREIREPIAVNEQIAGAFDSITYSKGGGVLAMLERYVGEEPFRAGVRLHMERHAHATATAEDFIASLAEGSERVEIGGVFESYIAQAGVPVLSVRLDCGDEQNPSLEISQARYAPIGSAIDPAGGKWQVPVCINFLDGVTPKNTCELLGEKKQSIVLEADHCPTQVHPNADGAGYYRFSMDDAGWLDLISGVADSPAVEALVVADSLDAAFRAGGVSADIYVAGMAALSNHGAWDVSDAATTYLEAITDIFDAGQMEPVEDALRNIVRPRFAALAGKSDAGTSLLRQRLQRFLLVVAKDKTMRETLAAQAAARIGLDGDPDLSAVSESELETALTVGVQDLGEPFFELLLEQAIASRDPAFRSSATGALGRVEDPGLVRKLQVALLAGRFKGTEFTRILFRQMARDASAALTYAWIKEHGDVVVERIPETFRSRTMPALGGSFCGADQAIDWQSFIESHAGKLPGYERSLAQATEGIRLCAGLRDARAAELVAAFERL